MYYNFYIFYYTFHVHDFYFYFHKLNKSVLIPTAPGTRTCKNILYIIILVDTSN